jgi:hypothetical protein
MIDKGLEELVHLKKLYLTRNRIQVLEGLHYNKKLQVYSSIDEEAPSGHQPLYMYIYSYICVNFLKGLSYEKDLKKN